MSLHSRGPVDCYDILKEYLRTQPATRKVGVTTRSTAVPESATEFSSAGEQCFKLFVGTRIVKMVYRCHVVNRLTRNDALRLSYPETI